MKVNENEPGHSTEEYTIRPVDNTKSYRRRTVCTVENVETEEDLNENTNDMMDFSFDIPELSQLNLVMGVGTQTQKMLDYCSTLVPLSPTVVYGSDQQQNRAASNINKKVSPSNINFM
ncbi:hypothetical protein Hanom_Chr15g01379101 [Helianthus anomalus]